MKRHEKVINRAETGPPHCSRGLKAFGQDLAKLKLWLAKFPSLDTKAMAALDELDPRDAVKALQELEQKGPGIRNPSAWVCKTAQNVKERRRRSQASCKYIAFRA